jgi:hypothetical protein
VLDVSRRTLFAEREKREHPFRDEKVIVAWNGLMLSAYADAFRATGRGRYLEVAERTLEFLDAHLWREGRLLHAWKDGEAKVPGFLDDHAALGIACLDLFEATSDPGYLERAERLARILAERFHDDAAGGFFFTDSEGERLIVRTKPGYDGSVPSGNSLAAELFLRLHWIGGNDEHRAKGEGVLRLYADAMARNPFAFANLLAVLDFHLRTPCEVAVVARGGPSGAASLLVPLGRHYGPNRIVFCYDPDSPPAFVPPFAREKPVVDGKPTAYVCRGFTCSPPVTDWPALAALVDAASR